MSQTRKVSDRALAILLSVLMFVSIIPFGMASVAVTAASEISTDLGSIAFTVGEAAEFIVASTANDDAGKMVKGSFTFSDPDAIASLEYFETAEGSQGWYNLPLTSEFGPAGGFELTDGTSRFRVTFSKAGSYTADIALKDPESSTVYCSTTAEVTVKSKASTISTDISDREFVVNQSAEFYFETVANGDADRMVKGSFTFSDPDAIESLEYYETADGYQGWYTLPLTSDFGPAAGFPMQNAKSRFRVTFSKAGNFDVTVSMKEVGTGAVLCSISTQAVVNKAKIIGISFAPTTNKYDDGKEFALVEQNGTLQDGDKVTYTLAGDSYDSVPKKSAVGEYTVDITVYRNENYEPYTETVTSKIELGELELGGIQVTGLNGTYSGKPQEVVSVTGAGNYSLRYKLSTDAEWSDKIPTVTDAGKYTVNVKAVKENYNDKDVSVAADETILPFNVYIAKAEQKDFAFDISDPVTLAYDSTAVYAPVGGQSDGKVTYKVIEGEEYLTVDGEIGEIKAVKAGGTATVQADIEGNNNYKPASAAYTVSTVKADQTGFAFENAEYSVQYGMKELTVKAVGGQSGGDVVYSIVDSDAATVNTANGAGIISFVSGRKGSFTVEAVLDGGENYNDIAARAEIKVETNDFGDKYTVSPAVPSTGWYTDSVTLKPADGYEIALSGEFSADWQDGIVIAAEGRNTPDPFYLREIATGYISEAITVGEICIDKTAPTELGITYSKSVRDIILETITFGFYKADMTVTMTAVDKVSGIDRFVYKIGDSSEFIISRGDEAFVEGEDGVVSADFVISPDLRSSVITMTVYDAAELSTELVGGKTLIVDKTAPIISVAFDNNEISNGTYFKAERTATIAVEEENFFKDYIYNEAVEDGRSLGYKYMTIKVGTRRLGETEFIESYIEPVFTEGDDGIYRATVEFSEDADYTFEVVFYDYSLNKGITSFGESKAPTAFTVDKTAPVVNVAFSEPAHSNGNQYRADREAVITVTEHNFDAKDFVASVATTDAQGEVFDYASYLANNENWQSDGDVHTATVRFATEAHYVFDVKYTDLAGNVYDSFDEAVFTVDKTAPDKLDITIDGVSVLGSMETFEFNRFYGAAVTAKLSADCSISGLESVRYQKLNDVTEYREDGEWIDYDDASGIVVAPNEKFVIYFRFEDRAGNVSIARSTGIVVDDKEPIGETKAPEIDILPAAPNANGIHNGDVGVELKVIDPKYTGASASENGYYSGLNRITYRIYTTDTDALEEGTLLELGRITAGAEFDADRLVSSWSGRITVDSAKFNSNNVIVEVKAVDNAGNQRVSTTAVGDIRIDITAPRIDISYDNNDADSGSFFKADRTATIVVTERNFDPDDVKIVITDTDGTAPTLGGWVKTAGTGNLDDTTWTTTVSYTSDGDYTFSIAYTDMADNSCPGAVYADGTVAATEFTIDKTMPVVSVEYDNNNAENGKYFAASRTATVTVVEHNFDADRVVFTQTAALNGANIAIPAASAWISDGDVHTATIQYSNDGDYTFDVTVKDMAGNDSVMTDYGRSVAGQDFTVDKTIDAPVISGVVNGNAYKNDVIPSISFDDVNYLSYSVKLTRTRKDEKNIDVTDKYIGSIVEQAQGGAGVFDTFDKSVVENDGIYTLTVGVTDKAGNKKETVCTFTVNRFGSVYEYSKELISLIKNGGQYVTEVNSDLVIVEYSADKLLDGSLKVIITRDGEAVNADYTSLPRVVEEDEAAFGDSGWYEYVYTVKSSNFAKDGVYKITLTSAYSAVDSAENESTSVPENSIYIDDGGKIADVVDQMNFTVDSVAPEIRNIVNLDKKIADKDKIENGKLNVKYTVVDVGGLESIEVVLNGKSIQTLTSEDLASSLYNYNGSFDIEEQSGTTAQKVRIIVTDRAGNVTDTGSEEFINAHSEDNENSTFIFHDEITVSRNIFVRWYANTVLFWGSVGGTVVVVGAICFLIAAKRKKKTEAK